MSPEKMNLQWIAVLLLVNSCRSFKHYFIKETNSSCYPKDTCNTARDTETIGETNCDCDSNCNLYKTCCIDSLYLNTTRRSTKYFSSCITVDEGTTSVFMVDYCHRDYDGPIGIRKKCEDSELDSSDPFAFAPVTNKETRTTYKSLFCAICNFEKTQSLTMWQLMLECSSLGEYMHLCTRNRDFVLNNIMYIKDDDKWGLWSWDKKTDWMFRYLPIIYRLPDTLSPYVRPCRPYLHSECSSDWTDVRVKRLCKSYMGAVYFPNIAFRNAHCAMCNRVKNFSDMTCHSMYSSPFRSPTALSFGLLLDFNLSDGEVVGRKDKCEKEQVYDPLSKKCRRIECPLPGFKVRGGRCTRESEGEEKD